MIEIMKVLSLEIDNFKSLHNFRIDFSVGSSTILLGKNGTGKSHLLEALIIIFLELESGANPSFKYRMTYECRKNIIHIEAEPMHDKGEKIQVSVDNLSGESIKIGYQQLYADYENGYPRFLPNHIFSYYSGVSNRMANLFLQYQEGIYKEVLQGIEKLSHSFSHAYHDYGPLALLAFYIEEDKDIQKFLEKEIGIQKIISALFVLKKPPWNSKDGDPRFWGTRGIVSQLLARMYEIALAPMHRNARIGSFDSTTNLEHLYLYLRGEKDIKKLFSYYENRRDFFKALESIYISNILGGIRIQLQKCNTDGTLNTLTFQDLSEGEQQLLMVLGLLRFTREDEALCLLDEPDTHLNPAWSIQYLEFMQRVVGEQPTSHVIMTTHNPLMIAGLEREQVRIMQRDSNQGRGAAEIPEENPQGMGVAAILTSDLFGLRSTLDKITQNRLDRRRELAFRNDENLTEEDEKELNRLNNILSRLDFSITARDPLYQDFASEYRNFVRRFTLKAEDDLKQGIVFTPEQRQRQRELTRQILHEIKEQQL